MAPIILELARHPNHIVSRVCVTGQHRQMLDQVLSLFRIAPDYDLNVMQHSQSPIQVAASVLTGLDSVLHQERPDWVLVQGDTTTVMAAAIAAFYAKVKVGHVEAGLRSFDKWQPFPEEINRKIAGVVADLHFAPTERSRRNLLSEGIADEHIRVTGNSVIDALQWVSQMPYNPTGGPLHTIPWEKRIILVTAHRRESFGAPLKSVCQAIRTLAEMYRGDVHFVYPVHLNPNVQKTVYSLLADLENVTLLPPLDYQPLVYLMNHSYLVLTDSGGIQEEAPGLGKPVLVLRQTTERPEAVEAGTVKLVGTDQATIVAWATRLLDSPAEYAAMSQAVNPYGDGLAARRIVEALLK